ncbi:MAG: hypothetical protein AAGA10_30570 [Bacteroidota bacterium]
MKTTQKLQNLLIMLGALFLTQLTYAQPGELLEGSHQWYTFPNGLYVTSSKIGIGTDNPYRKLEVSKVDDLYIRIQSVGGNSFSEHESGIELRRKLGNGTSRTWTIYNKDRLYFKAGSVQRFSMGSESASFGTIPHPVTVSIAAKNISNLGYGNFLYGGLELVGSGSSRISFDANQMESTQKYYMNNISDQDIIMVQGGGNIGIGTTNSEARLNIDGEGYQLKLHNPGNQGAAWRIGSSHSGWASGAGKLVFTHTAASSDATLAMTSAGKVGIGLTTPSRTLHVNGTTKTNILEIAGGADIAEPFNVADAEELSHLPGTVVSIDPQHPGALKVSESAYEKSVAGIISGAGNIQPGMVMGQDGSIADGAHPVALSGRVFCKVDASYGAIQPGDLLTSSNTPGHAMKVQNHKAAQGAIIGKAMTTLSDGKGLVLVLVSLQ